jgi:phage FluMu protein Com
MALAPLAAEERRLIRCDECGNILAAEVAGLSIVTSQGKEWTGWVVSIKCPNCRTVWRRDSPPV